jgi:acetyl esterase/lipase
MRSERALFAILALLLSLVFLSGTYAQADVTVERNIVYATHEGMDLRLDIAFPIQGKGPLPALIFISGSGWGHWWGPSFDRSQYSSAILKAAKNGYVAIAADYRPTSIRAEGSVKYPYPCQLIDVRSAVRWLRGHSLTYNIDPSRIGAVGWSSGAHLSLLLGLMGSELRIPGEAMDEDLSSTVQAVVSIGGPTDLALLYRESTFLGIADAVSELMGGSPDALGQKYMEASPIHYLHKGSAPILMIQGAADLEVPPDQATLFAARADDIGASVRLILLKYLGHINLVDNKEIYPFLDSVLK